ncbi:MAG: exo-alpha-sialidase [Verrucomicrobiae bacterium]|nr:exo-alpha-sialidase [Verrucomicrobiae bacterium]
MKLKSRTLSFRAPARGTVAYEFAYYTRPTGWDQLRLRHLELRDDIYDGGEFAFSNDNGRTWPEVQPYRMSDTTAQGVIRRNQRAGFVDPLNGRLLQLEMQGLLRNDHALDGLAAWHLRYRVSEDGGRTALVEAPVVQDGFTPTHPFAPIWVGKNAMMLCSNGAILRCQQGHLLVATQFTPLGTDGRLHNPGGGYTWTEVLLLFGHWQDDGRIQWKTGSRLGIGPDRSTRGLIEPTLTQMPDGRILMVLRGSNDAHAQLPGHKWHCISNNGGRIWTAPQPWRYSDGTPFFSPSSCSQFLTHSSGRRFWLGNLCPSNPAGSHPRYPLVAGEVDPVSLGLIRESLCLVDTRQPDDPPSLMLSNFYAHEDRASGELVVWMTRMTAEHGELNGDVYLYRIEL